MKNENEITINNEVYIKKSEVKNQEVNPSNRVLVRTRLAGIHVGELVSRDELTLVLKNSNRIHKWRGAMTLSEVAMKGVNRKEYTRISCLLPLITLTHSDVCEVIPVAEGLDFSEVENG